MSDASKLDILSATSALPPLPAILIRPVVHKHSVRLKLCTLMNVKTGGLDLKNERVNLSKHTNTAMFATTNVWSVSENRALVVTQHIVKKKRRLTEMNCIV